MPPSGSILQAAQAENQLAEQEAEQAYNTNNASVPSASSIASLGSTADQAQQALNQGASGTTGAVDTGAAAGPHPGILQRLLPTAGAIGGGILGEVIDPFGGGIAGAALGAGLAGAGAAGGKAIENVSSGQGAGNGVLTSGLEGAAGQGLAAGAGAALGVAGKGLESTAASMSENAADKTSQAIANQTYKSIPKGLRQAHDLQGSLDLASKVGADASNPQNLIDTGNQANEILDNSVNDALGQSGPVDASDYNDIVKNAIASRSGVLGSYDPVALSKGRLGPANTPAAKLLTQLQQYGQGVATQEADPTAVRQLMQQVGKAYGDSEPGVAALTGAKDPVQVATHDALGDVYNSLKDKLFNRPEVADNFKALEGNIQPSDVGGNVALAGHLNDVLGNATDHQGVLDSLKQFGNLRNIGHDAQVADQGLVVPVAKSGLNTGNVIDLGGMAEATLGHHPGLGIMAPLLYHGIQNPALVGGAGSLLGKAAGSMLPTVAGQVIANSPNDVAGPAGAGNDISGNIQSMTPQNSVLDQALQQDLTMARQAEADPYLAGNYSTGINQIPSLIQAVQHVNQAQAAEQAMAQNYNLAGGAQGPLGGILSSLGARFTGGEAASYPAQVAAEAQAIAQATGMQPQQVEAALPKITQNRSAAQASLGNIQSLIQALQLGTPNTGLVSAASQ